MLYEEGMELRDVTCPCGCGYWDAFSEAFVSGDQIRHGKAPPRTDYEARVKAKTNPEEYEAMLRKQFIKHFLDCDKKRKLDESDPSNDGSTRRRAEAELREISNGDFRSRGRTASRGDMAAPARSSSRSDMSGPDRHETSVDRHRDMQPRHRRGDTNPVRTTGRTVEDLGEIPEGPTRHDPPSYAQSVSTTSQRVAVAARNYASSAAEPHLTSLSTRFVSIPKGDYAASRAFISRNPEVMDENGTALLRAALASLKAGQTSHAKSCVEKALMIQECVGLSSNGIRDFLQDLARSSSVRDDFEDAFDAAYRKIKQRAEESGPLPSAPLPVAVPISGVSRRGYESQGRPSIPSSTLEARPTGRRSFSTPLSYALDNLSISTSGRTHRDTSLSRTQSSEQTGRIMVPRPNVVGRPLRSPSPGGFDIKGSQGDGDIEELDQRFRKRRDPESFFSVGRVFAILSHERSGRRQVPGPDENFRGSGRLGDRAMTSVRRMVVVRQRDGYSWCLEIKTYGGLGVATPGITPVEIRAHAVIHDERQAPRRKAEERGLLKEPIAVAMAAADVKIDEMSRLNFAAAQSVEWTVKVMNIGRVSSKNESMARLVMYWQEEMGMLDTDM